MHGRPIFAVQEVLCSGQPAPHGCHEGGVEQQVHGDPHRGARRGDRLAGGAQLGVGPLPRVDGHVEVPRPVRSVGEHRQIGDAQLTMSVCLLKQIERDLPVAPLGSGVGPNQRAVGGDVAHRTHSTVVTAVTALLTPLGRDHKSDPQEEP
jgi:hypothetical protein